MVFRYLVSLEVNQGDISIVKRFLIVVVILGLAIVAVVAYRNTGDHDRVTYLTAPVQRGDLVTTIRATGTVKAVLTVKVGSQLSGQIAELFADFNDVVKKGEPIAALDPRTFAAKVREAKAAVEVAQTNVLIKRAAVEKANANLANAVAVRSVAKEREASALAKYNKLARDLGRKQPLFERGTISVSALDEVRADRDSASADLAATKAEKKVKDAEISSANAGLRMAEAEHQNALALVKQKKAALEQAEIELERSVIRAPIDGVIIGRDVDRGQTVATSLEAPTLFVIAQDLKEMEVHAKIDEADIGRVRVGQRVTFTVDSFPGRRFAGKVTQIRKAAKTIQNVVIYTVVISATNHDLVLLPGMTAAVRIVVDETVGVLKVPNTALRFRPPGAEAVRTGPSRVGTGEAVANGIPATVWVLDGERRPTAVHIRIGNSDRRTTEVVSGPLNKGQEIIVGASEAREGPSAFGFRLGF